MKKFLLACGIASPLVYLFTVILGASLRSDYNHVYNAISELTVKGAPNRLLLNCLFSIYSLLGLLFAIGGFLYLRAYKIKKLKIAMVFLTIAGALSLSWALFPQDVRGTQGTFQGIMHLVLGGIVAPITIACPLLIGIGIRKFKNYKGFAVYSIIASCMIFVSGGLAAFAPSNASLSPYMGLLERFTIGSYQLWILVTAIILLKDLRRGKG